MKALWIRVEARKVSSPEICELADALAIPPVHALGHYAALGGEIAEHTPDGNIADVADATLERWAQWSGKRGVFAAEVRRVFQAVDGEFDDWADTMGKLVEQRERDRQRKKTGKSVEIPRKKTANSSETPGKIHGKSTSFRGVSGATERNGTERDGTVTDLYQESSNRRSGIVGAESPAASASAPPADANVGEVATAFLQCFYADAGYKRRDDVMRQIVGTLTPSGVRLGKGEQVRAGSPERLVAKMREVYRESATIKDRDKAIVVLLRKLGDTSDGSAPGVAAAADVEREERASESDVAAAEQWLEQLSPATVEALERRVDRQLGIDSDEQPLSDMQLAARRMARTSLVVQGWRAWHEANPPEPHTVR